MSQPNLRLVSSKDKPLRTGKAVPEIFIGNMPFKNAGNYTLLGGAFVSAQARDEEERAEIYDLIGVVKTHKRTFLINNTSGVVMKLR